MGDNFIYKPSKTIFIKLFPFKKGFQFNHHLSFDAEYIKFMSKFALKNVRKGETISQLKREKMNLKFHILFSTLVNANFLEKFYNIKQGERLSDKEITCYACDYAMVRN